MFKFGKKKNEKPLPDTLLDLRKRIEGQASNISTVEENKKANNKPKNSNKSNGNGKKPKEAIEQTIPMENVKSKKPDDINISNTETDLEKEMEYQRLQAEIETEAKIPGNGWLFNIKDKHLPESTVLDRGEVLAFALGNMQENMLNPRRKESLFAMFSKDIMRMNISIKGLAREQALMARQQDADKNATMSSVRDLMGKPGVL